LPNGKIYKETMKKLLEDGDLLGLLFGRVLTIP